MEKNLVILPPEVKELALQVSDKKQEEVKSVLIQIFNGTDNWTKQVENIHVKDINDTMSIQLADTARKNAKDARLSAEKIFDAKRSEVQNEMRDYKLEDSLWLKSKQIMQVKFKAIEEKAKYKADFVKRHEAELHEAKTKERLAKIEKYNPEINRIEIEHLSDDMFETVLNGLIAKENERIAAEKKAEDERIEAERKEAARVKQLAIENERLKKEAEEKEKELLEAEKERQRLAKIESDKLEKERKERESEAERLRKIQQQKINEEKAKADKLANELQAKKDAEIETENKRLEAIESEASKGDSAKVKDLINDLNLLKSKYTFKSKKNQKMYEGVNISIDKITAWMETK